MLSFSRLGQIGNLGNQLFQIASVCGLAEQRNDVALFPAGWPYWEYFSMPDNSIFDNIPQLPSCIETEFTYNPDQFRNDSDIEGYLQSYKYFSKEQPLKLKEPLPPIDAVAISIRRGDLINNPVYDTPPIEYYIKAYEAHFHGKKIYLFSDDPLYCEWHFAPYKDCVTIMQESPIEQLRIGAACRWHIISNSTFSWWMRWLHEISYNHDACNIGTCIRPRFNFSEWYRETHPERDYWPESWQIFDWRQQDKWDLTDVTFTIPVQIDSARRVMNLAIAVDFLRKYFHTNIHIMENATRKCEHYSQWCKYTHVNHKDFHRTKMLNDMAREATTPYVCNFDCDTVFTPLAILEAVRRLREGYEIVYPFDGTVIRIPWNHPDKVRDISLYLRSTGSADVGCITNVPLEAKKSSVGHLLFVNKEAFFKAGGENEHFVSYGPEDAERWKRFNKLEMRIARVPGPTFHLNHPLTTNSCNKAPYYEANHTREQWQEKLSKEELINEIKTWHWI